MNRSLNVFFGVLVCVGLIVGLFVWTKRSMSDSDKLNPYDFYNSVAGATYSVGGSGGVGMADGGLSVPMRSSSSMFRYRGASSYAPAYTAPNSLIASSPYRLDASASPLYATSSATMKSFGGGNAMGGSVSMSGGAVSSAHNSPIASSPSGLLASSPNSLIASSPITSSPNFSFYGTQTMGTEVYSGAGIYAGIGNTTSGSRGIRGRFNAPPGMGGEEGDSEGSSYEAWLEWMWRHGWRFGTVTGENTWYYNSDQSRAAFEAWYLSVYGVPYDESNALTPPEFTYSEWLQWISGTHTYNGYTFTPVGDILPLILMVLAYIGYLYYKRRRMMRTRSFVN